MKTWILVDDGKIGTENQCLGLSAALGLTPDVYRIDLPPTAAWLTALPASMAIPLAPRLSSVYPALPTEARPDLILTAGRRSAALALWVKHVLSTEALLIALQAPPFPASLFDWVISPVHDKLTGPNVLATQGALNAMTPSTVMNRAAPFREQVATFPKPITAVLIGGAAKGVKMTAAFADEFGQRLSPLLDGSLLLSTSRRTPPEAAEALKKRLTGFPGLQYYGIGENPYAAIMAYADSIVVTSDSMSMLSEACTAGKPVYIAEVPSKREKHRQFAESLYAQGLARPLRDTVAPFETPGLAEAHRIAVVLKQTDAFRRKLPDL